MPPILHRGHGILLRDLLIFQIKLVLDAFKDVALIHLSIGAAVIDLLFGRPGRLLLFYRVLRMSERFDLWLNLHGPALEAETHQEGLFGVSDAGDHSLVGKLEQIAQERISRVRAAR